MYMFYIELSMNRMKTALAKLVMVDFRMIL